MRIRLFRDQADIPEGEARGLPAADGAAGLVLARRHGRLFGYLNACPHLGVTLDGGSGQFLDGSGTHILCAAHGALFRIEDGLCVQGPCLGEHLVAASAHRSDSGSPQGDGGTCDGFR